MRGLTSIFSLIAIVVAPSTLVGQATYTVPSYTVPSDVDQLPPPPDSYLNAATAQQPIPIPATSVPVQPTPPPASPLQYNDTAVPYPPPVSTPSPIAIGVNSPEEPVIVAAPRRSWWYEPFAWLPEEWNNNIEVGLNGTEGNAQTMSFLAGAKFKRQTDWDNFALTMTHRKTTADSVETQNNSYLGTDYDYRIGQSNWTWFLKQGLEHDEFKAFNARYNINSGVGYYWIRTDDTKLLTRFGAGTSREIGGPDDSWVPEAVFGVETNHQINKRNKVYATMDYFPQWDNFSDYRFVSDVGWEVLLDDESNLSFKVGATNRYDSTPLGRKPSDLNYSLILLYKF